MKHLTIFSLFIFGFTFSQTKQEKTSIQTKDSTIIKLSQKALKNSTEKGFYKNLSENDAKKYSILNAKPENTQNYSSLNKNVKPSIPTIKDFPKLEPRKDSLKKKIRP